MGVFEKIIICIADDTYDTESERIRADIELSLHDGSSNDYIIDLAYDLQLIEMAHTEGIPVYDEDDKADTIARLTEILKCDYNSFMCTYIGKNKIVVGGF